MKRLPVFFHVPKCAGTYAISLMWELLRVYSGVVYDRKLENIVCNICVLTKNTKQVQLRALVQDKTLFCKSNSFFKKTETKNDFFLDLDNINLLCNLDIFAIIIEAGGFLNYAQLLKNFENYELKPFIFLRDPFSLICSLYTYLTHSSSEHELTHGSFDGFTLSEYLKSYYVSDSWIIRNLLKLEDNHMISETDYKNTINALKNFKVSDYKAVEQTTDEVFNECYGLSIKQINERSYKRIQERINKSNTGHLKLKDLDLETQQKFLERTYWDKLLYDHYV